MDKSTVRRCITAAVALTAAGALAGAVPALTPALPDVQIREADLTANVSDLQGSEINALYQHVQQEFSGSTDVVQHSIGVGDLFSTHDGLGLAGSGPVPNADDVSLDDSSVSNLIGGGLDPAIIQGPPIIDALPANVFPSGTAGGLFGATDQAISNAMANFIAFSAADAIPGLQAAYQAVTDGLVAAELAFNSALVNSQSASIDQYFGSNTPASDFIGWVFSLNNASLAQTETALNSLLGANFDPQVIHGSLVTALNSEGFTLGDWAKLLGIPPDELSQVVNAVAASNLFGLLGGTDLGSIFGGLFG